MQCVFSSGAVFTLVFVYFLDNCKAGEISNEKCKEYGKAVYVTETSPVLSRIAKENTVADCGIVSVPLIIGGVEAKEKEFPHMALIGYGHSPEEELSWDCGAALISELFLLTAAHCMSSREKGSPQKAKLGQINLEDDSDLQIKTVVSKEQHPQYNRATKYHDIALFKLDSPVEFTAYVRPACLNHLQDVAETQAIATGFGKLDYSANAGSKHLMKVQLQIIPKAECDPFFKDQKRQLSKGITDDIVCAGHLTGGKDTCQGDSGGPLQIVLREPYCMYSLIGVTSFGKFCGYANSPAIYTRVSRYIDWIESVVWK